MVLEFSGAGALQQVPANPLITVAQYGPPQGDGSVERMCRNDSSGPPFFRPLARENFQHEGTTTMKDLSLQTKGLMAKANGSEPPKGAKKSSYATSSLEPLKDDKESIYFPIGVNAQTAPAVSRNSPLKQSKIEPGRLVIGPGVVLKGRIERCKTLEVRGEVEAEIECDRLIIDEGGILKGTVATRTAEISGSLSGTARVREKVMIRAAGRFSGKLSYGAIRIELGGLATGELEEITSPKEAEFKQAILVGELEPIRLQKTIIEIENVSREIPTIQVGAQT